jgi:hypothetical protein
MFKDIFIIFGAGEAGRKLVNILPVKVEYFVDNNPDSWGTYCNGFFVQNPAVLLREDKSRIRIFIASMYFTQIKQQLNEMGFERNRHYFNIIPYYGLLKKEPFLDAIAAQALSKVGNRGGLFQRLQMIFDLQNSIVECEEKQRFLLLVEPNRYDLNIVERLKRKLTNFFKLDIIIIKEEFSLLQDEAHKIARKYKKTGYERLLYLGLNSQQVETFGEQFAYFYSIEVEEIVDKKRWLDHWYDILNKLGFGFKKVSVVVPNYNYEEYIGRRLRTIFWQKYPIYEIIFLDDASLDESVILAKQLLSEFDGLQQIIVNKYNSGSVFRQWKKGIESVQGDYIWIAETDDYASSMMLRSLMNYFVEDNNVVLSFCDSMYVDNEGDWEGFCAEAYLKNSKEVECAGGIYDGKMFIKEYLAITNGISNVSALVIKQDSIKPEYLEAITTFRRCGDWYFYILLLRYGKIAYHALPMNFLYRHSKAVTINVNQEEQQRELELVKIAVMESLK